MIPTQKDKTKNVLEEDSFEEIMSWGSSISRTSDVSDSVKNSPASSTLDFLDDDSTPHESFPIKTSQKNISSPANHNNFNIGNKKRSIFDSSEESNETTHTILGDSRERSNDSITTNSSHKNSHLTTEITDENPNFNLDRSKSTSSSNSLGQSLGNQLLDSNNFYDELGEENFSENKNESIWDNDDDSVFENLEKNSNAEINSHEIEREFSTENENLTILEEKTSAVTTYEKSEEGKSFCSENMSSGDSSNQNELDNSSNVAPYSEKMTNIGNSSDESISNRDSTNLNVYNNGKLNKNYPHDNYNEINKDNIYTSESNSNFNENYPLDNPAQNNSNLFSDSESESFELNFDSKNWNTPSSGNLNSKKETTFDSDFQDSTISESNSISGNLNFEKTNPLYSPETQYSSQKNDVSDKNSNRKSYLPNFGSIHKPDLSTLKSDQKAELSDKNPHLPAFNSSHKPDLSTLKLDQKGELFDKNPQSPAFDSIHKPKSPAQNSIKNFTLKYLGNFLILWSKESSNSFDFYSPNLPEISEKSFSDRRIFDLIRMNFNSFESGYLQVKNLLNLTENQFFHEPLSLCISSDKLNCSKSLSLVDFLENVELEPLQLEILKMKLGIPHSFRNLHIPMDLFKQVALSNDNDLTDSFIRSQENSLMFFIIFYKMNLISFDSYKRYFESNFYNQFILAKLGLVEFDLENGKCNLSDERNTNILNGKDYQESRISEIYCNFIHKDDLEKTNISTTPNENIKEVDENQIGDIKGAFIGKSTAKTIDDKYTEKDGDDKLINKDLIDKTVDGEYTDRISIGKTVDQESLDKGIDDKMIDRDVNCELSKTTITTESPVKITDDKMIDKNLDYELNGNSLENSNDEVIYDSRDKSLDKTLSNSNDNVIYDSSDKAFDNSSDNAIEKFPENFNDKAIDKSINKQKDSPLIDVVENKKAKTTSLFDEDSDVDSDDIFGEVKKKQSAINSHENLNLEEPQIFNKNSNDSNSPNLSNSSEEIKNSINISTDSNGISNSTNKKESTFSKFENFVKSAGFTFPTTQSTTSLDTETMSDKNEAQLSYKKKFSKSFADIFSLEGNSTLVSENPDLSSCFAEVDETDKPILMTKEPSSGGFFSFFRRKPVVTQPPEDPLLNRATRPLKAEIKVPEKKERKIIQSAYANMKETGNIEIPGAKVNKKE